jgi:hypothetical protein
MKGEHKRIRGLKENIRVLPIDKGKKNYYKIQKNIRGLGEKGDFPYEFSTASIPAQIPAQSS